MRTYLEERHAEAQAAAAASGTDADRATAAWYRLTLRHLTRTEAALAAIREQVMALVPAPTSRDIVSCGAICEVLEELLTAVRAADAAIQPAEKSDGYMS
ncbi:hypothetical protein GCM10023147_45620 [Tsukamurella soli]|uniref:Uncharacterized protein n=2 Tax=Tsukamurella soli TaxID=644556 RepID=A0ABP8KD06_9ACTN